MQAAIVQSQDGVTLVGGGAFGAQLLGLAKSLAPRIVAADGGANRLLRLGVEPEAVIGDLDSISPAARARLAGRLFSIDEQATTDFDKALRHIAAPFVLGLGLVGPRLDHGLAALTSLGRHPDRRCLLLTQSDVTFLAPARLVLRLAPGTRLSLYPLGPVRGESQGLEWPLAGQSFAPDGAIGTSNRVSAAEVHLAFDAPRMLVILPRAALRAALDALRPPPAARGG